MDANGYSERLCAFADILGFKELLGDLSKPKIQSLLAKIHHPFAELALDEDDFRVQSISDAVTISTLVTKNGLIALIHALEGLTFELLAQGYFIRGALIKGALHHDDEMVFGPALVEAFRLESEVVEYPRVMVHSNVLRAAKEWLGKGYKEHIRHADDGPCFLHVLRWLEMAMMLSEPPREYPAILLTDCQSMIQKRFRQSIDEPNHFKKVQWFAKYWNSIVPPEGKNGIGRIKGAGSEQQAAVWG